MSHDHIKLAVDIQWGILAGGGELHADCQQANVWGADWYPSTRTVGYESLINIRPRQGNRSMEIQDPAIRERINQIAQKLLGGT